MFKQFTDTNGNGIYIDPTCFLTAITIIHLPDDVLSVHAHAFQFSLHPKHYDEIIILASLKLRDGNGDLVMWYKFKTPEGLDIYINMLVFKRGIKILDICPNKSVRLHHNGTTTTLHPDEFERLVEMLNIEIPPE